MPVPTSLTRRILPVLALALLWGVPARTAECPAWPGPAAALWGLDSDAWAKACAEKPDLDLRQVQERFILACVTEFAQRSELGHDLVMAECRQGVPGRQRLLALQSAAQPASFQPEDLDRLYTGSVVRPPLQAGGAPAEKVPLGSYLTVDPKLPPKEQAYLNALLQRMQDSGEGRRILQGMVEESRLGKSRFRVSMKTYDKSIIVDWEGFENISGGSYGEAEPDSRTIRVSRTLLRFSSPEAAVDNAVGTLAHELTHLWRNARVKRLLPRFAQVFDLDRNDEEVARLKGMLAAAETHRGKPNVDTQDAADLLIDPDRYYERMQLRCDVYAMTFSAAEMLDPAAAFRQRLQALRGALQERQRLLAELPRRLRQIKHLSACRGLAPRLRDLLARTVASQKTLPELVSDTKEAMAQVKKQLEAFQTRAGKKLIAGLRAAAADPEYQSLQREQADDLARLRRHQLPRLEPTDQLSQADLEAWVERDKNENPSHSAELE